jgi:hypothetical protein
MGFCSLGMVGIKKATAIQGVGPFATRNFCGYLELALCIINIYLIGAYS